MHHVVVSKMRGTGLKSDLETNNKNCIQQICTYKYKGIVEIESYRDGNTVLYPSDQLWNLCRHALLHFSKLQGVVHNTSNISYDV